MQVEYLVRISLPDDGRDVNILEEACWKAGREASQGLFLSALEQRDREVVAAPSTVLGQYPALAFSGELE